jgi:hypothetical protein
MARAFRNVKLLRQWLKMRNITLSPARLSINKNHALAEIFNNNALQASISAGNLHTNTSNFNHFLFLHQL